ncbi:hypothetical protein K388_06266 [Streptomyces sp. KhCrAH-43]|uniref:PH-like domain-containing protein n=1 Tax=unclassified Streptomyces TaxID=2593676 RepID=UPI00036CFCFA|nr:hypothetical protein [Streptomyces sp. KhCrAH-43]MYS37094.1 hypothetical protein [Streptomyces sp. SID4920]MYX64441.1 hypothetical protein [Streptomyces sp. SID8373]RAJ51332.1 hypothetical protein K388_06266 [Streptomyces sp. KhCrAH-43]
MTTQTLYQLAAEQKSAEVTDWSARISWVIGLVVLVVFVYWLMRQGWKWRGNLQSDLPAPATVPDGYADGEKLLTLSGRYHASTTAGQWLDRIVAHGLGTRSRVELTLTADGLDVVRPGAADFFVPVADLRGARTEKALAGKVLPEGGLLVITWALGDRLIDSGFRSDHSAEHPAWVDAVNHLTSTTEGIAR